MIVNVGYLLLFSADMPDALGLFQLVSFLSIIYENLSKFTELHMLCLSLTMCILCAI